MKAKTQELATFWQPFLVSEMKIRPSILDHIVCRAQNISIQTWRWLFGNVDVAGVLIHCTREGVCADIEENLDRLAEGGGSNQDIDENVPVANFWQ